MFSAPYGGSAPQYKEQCESPLAHSCLPMPLLHASLAAFGAMAHLHSVVTAHAVCLHWCVAVTEDRMRQRLMKVKKEYDKELQAHGPHQTGASPSQWPHFQAMLDLVGLASPCCRYLVVDAILSCHVGPGRVG